MGKKSPPEPPAPERVGSAQVSQNIGTALAEAQLQNVNQITPQGTISYATDPSQTYTYVDRTDPNNPITYDLPRYTATTELSPNQQALLEAQERGSLGLANVAEQQIGFLGDYLRGSEGEGPLLGNAADDRLADIRTHRLDPIMAEREADLEQRLADKGIAVGSEAWEREKRSFDQARNDAYNQLILQGIGQQFGFAKAERDQPIDEVTALLSGSRVGQGYPQAAGFNAPNLATVDQAANMWAHHNAQMQNWQARQAATGQIFGGIGSGLGGLFGAFSDERLKKDKKKIGKLKGHNIYEYRFKGEDKDAPKTIGVMAQEAEKKAPNAVMTGPDGYKRVAYGELFGAN